MSKVVRIGLVSTVVLFVGIGGAWGVAEEALPEGLRGFSGQVRGVVVAKGEKNTFSFKVGRVLRVWKGSKAEAPESLAGRTIPVGPRWVKGESGKWQPVELHVAFIRQLKAGQEMTLEIHNVERSHFALLELSAEQRKLAQGEEVEPDRPTPSGSEAEVRELQAEVKRLRAEVAELRALLKKAGD